MISNWFKKKPQPDVAQQLIEKDRSHAIEMLVYRELETRLHRFNELNVGNTTIEELDREQEKINRIRLGLRGSKIMRCGCTTSVG